MLKCKDCGLPYRDFGLDTTLPNEQWLEICPEDDCVLCTNCMVKRAAKFDKYVAARMVLEG